MLPTALFALLIGIGATLTLDLWALLLKAAFGLPLPPWALVGRWFAHMPRGRFVHPQGIAQAAAVRHEKAIGWAMHYLIGIAFAFATLAIAPPDWPARPSFGPALTVGLLTVLCGWLLLSPGMGAGIAGARGAHPHRGRALNIVGHVVFALGMWGSALLLA